MAEIVRRRSWGRVLPLGRHVSISGSSLIRCASVSIAPPHPRRSKTPSNPASSSPNRNCIECCDDNCHTAAWQSLLCRCYSRDWSGDSVALAGAYLQTTRDCILPRKDFFRVLGARGPDRRCFTDFLTLPRLGSGDCSGRFSETDSQRVFRQK